MFGRLRRPADFEAVLATPARARSAHFAAYHVPRRPVSPRKPIPGAQAAKLSTVDPDRCPQAVDDRSSATGGAWWFGVVVPKRHARKATTRNLLRRQMRGAFDRHHAHLPSGMWLLRLRVGFDAGHFQSAAPAGLRHSARAELDALLKRAAA